MYVICIENKVEMNVGLFLCIIYCLLTADISQMDADKHENGGGSLNMIAHHPYLNIWISGSNQWLIKKCVFDTFNLRIYSNLLDALHRNLGLSVYGKRMEK